MDAHEASKLMLEWRDQQLVVTDSHVLEIGTEPGTDLSVDGQYVSRRHAAVTKRNNYYVLIDHSTNGTYVQTEDEQITFVRRGELRLWGAGWISLGEPLRPETAIRFQHT